MNRYYGLSFISVLLNIVRCTGLTSCNVQNGLMGIMPTNVTNNCIFNDFTFTFIEDTTTVMSQNLIISESTCPGTDKKALYIQVNALSPTVPFNLSLYSHTNNY